MEAHPDLEFEVTLRVMGRAVPRELVSRSLGIEPDRWHGRGTIPLSKAGRRIRPYREDLWARSWRGVGASGLETTLQSVADLLAGRLDSFRAMRTDELRIDLMIGIFSADHNLGITLSSRTLASIEKLGLDVHLDIYFTPDA